jgi:hypothetical protein
MKAMIIAIVVAVLLTWYAVSGRDWLKSKPWPWVQRFFAWIEPIEIKLFKKSQTILFARLKIVSGLILTGLTQAGTINLSPFMPLVPDEYQFYVNVAVNSLPIALSVMGWIDELLRNKTTAPLELVAIAEKDKTPEVEEAIAMADQTKTEAVEAVAQATAA